MAVYSPNPYSAGAVVFNQQPWEAFYERQAAKKQAKEDALDNYFRNLGNDITSAGMRSQDVPQLLQKQQEWRNAYAQNKAAILNPKLDNGKSYTDYMRLLNEQRALINESKDAHKSMDEIGKMKLNPQMSYVFEDPTFMDQIKKHDLPIGNPNRVGINLATLSMPPQPITTKDLEGLQKYLTGGVPFDKVPGQVENLPGYKTRTPIYQQYSPENQKVIAQHAFNAYDTDRRWRGEAVKTFSEVMNDPLMHKKYDAVSQQILGKPIDNERDAWAVKSIIDNNMKATEYKEGQDTYGRELALMGMRQKNAKELIDYRKRIDPNDTQLNNTWIDNYLEKSVQEAQSDDRNLMKIYTPHTTTLAHELKGDVVLSKALTRGKSEPDKIFVTKEGRIWPIFYKYGPEKDKDKNPIKGTSVVLKNENGHPIVDEDYSQPMTLEQTKLALGYKGQTKKELGKTMSGGRPKKESTNHQDPLGLF